MFPPITQSVSRPRVWTLLARNVGGRSVQLGDRTLRGSVTFVAEDGPWDPSKPEVVVGNPSDWYLEPHYSFDVGFIPNTPYAEFDTEAADRAIVAVSGFVAVELMKEIARHPKICCGLNGVSSRT